ncbi:MAG: Zn-dependent alcohol dehydrogenase [Anaerolineales bacterium]|nr:Zn-dependent alcohol dehydrogenase [Anaerolineales bacterium]
MKAAVCRTFGQPLVIEDVTLDPPQAGEVRVRVRAVAICHSDVFLIRGRWQGWALDAPIVAGHEAAGVVAETGSGVTHVKPGDPVIVSLLRACGRCFFCTKGQPFLCEGQFALAREHRLHDLSGADLNLGANMGAFAEEVVVEQSQVVPIPADMPLDRACLLACGVITGLGAVVNTAQVEPGSSVVVVGVGGVGLNAIQGAALSGAYPIMAVDVLDTKLAAARQFGATHTLNAQQVDLVREIRALTHGRGADYAFITVGNAAAVTQALGYVRRAGSVVAVGMPPAGAQAAVTVGDFVYDGQRLLGSEMGSTRLNVDVPKLVALYQAGRLKLDELITQRYPLEQINAAIDSMERGEALRNVIVIP